jgi:hypothetical protein
MTRTLLLALVASVLGLCDVSAQTKVHTERESASLSISSLTKKHAYKVGEQWAYTFKATVTAPKNDPLTIRAWTRFYAAYDVVPEVHGQLDDSKLSDVLATGGQVWRDGVPVVLWNVPDPKVFSRTTKTVVEPGKTAITTFKHNFGSAVKAGRFRRKLWFAIVVEPSPKRYMLLYSRDPTDVEFTAEGEEIDFDTYISQRREWDKTRSFKFHDEHLLPGNEKESPK